MSAANPKRTKTYDLDADDATLTFGASTFIDVTTANEAGVHGGSGIDWAVTNLGSISGSSALEFKGDATVINGATGKISDATGVNAGIYVKGTGLVTNAGSIVGSGPSSVKGDGGALAVYLAGGGTIVNKATGTIEGSVSMGRNGTVTNAGSIINSGESFAGIGLKKGGAVVNTGALGIGGSQGSGIYLAAGGIVLNSGRIIGSGAYMSGIESDFRGTIANVGNIKLSTTEHATGIEMKSGGSVTNKGTINVAATGGYAFGVDLLGGGSVTNSGSIIATTPVQDTGPTAIYSPSGEQEISSQPEGLVMRGGAGVVLMNGGSVANLAGGTISAPGGAGIYVGGGGTNGVSITNAGLISGGSSGYSVQFDNYFQESLAPGAIASNAESELASSGGSSIITIWAGIINTLTLETGSDLIGTASGSINAQAYNVLVFKGHGIASNDFVNFQALTVDDGADWTLSAAAQIYDTTVKGTLTVSDTGTLSGSLKIDTGTAILESSFKGNIGFESSGELKLGTAYSGTISDFSYGDKIDFLDLSFAKGDKESVASDVLTIQNASGGVLTTVNLENDSQIYTSAEFAIGRDAAGHILVSYK